MVMPILATSTSYDALRVILASNLKDVHSCRPENVETALLCLENVTTVYTTSHKDSMATHILIFGDAGSGKDFILEKVVQGMLIEGTVEKISRETLRADSVECHGRQDDVLLYHTECPMDGLLISKRRGGGDTGTKDRMSSGKLKTRALVFDARSGGRKLNTITHERKIIQYDATNFSDMKEVDPAISQRYIIIPMIPTTKFTGVRTNDQDLRKDSHTYVIHASQTSQQFLQLGKYEIDKMIGQGCMDDVTDKGALITLGYVWKELNTDSPAYGTIAPTYRALRQVLQLARTHSIRRVLTEAFLTPRGAHFAKKMTPEKLQTLPLIIKVADVASSLGQLAEYIGIYTPGEIQLIMALRNLWISDHGRKDMFAPRPSHSLFGMSSRFVRFKGSIAHIAKICAAKLIEIHQREKNCPTPRTDRMLYDCIKRLENPP
jgi:hypothetical protein